MRKVYGLLVKQWPRQLNFGQTNTNLLQVTLIRYQFKHVVPPTQCVLEDWSCRKAAGQKKAADSVSILQTCVKKGKERPFNNYYAPIHQHHRAHTLNWTLREERLNWQMPGEEEMTKHVSKIALIVCTMPQQQVSQTGERGEVGRARVGGKRCTVHLNKANEWSEIQPDNFTQKTLLLIQAQTKKANFRVPVGFKAQNVKGACDLNGWYKVDFLELRLTSKSIKPNRNSLCPFELWL